MKRMVLLFAVLLMTVPAMGQETFVTLNCVRDTNEVTVSYLVTGTDHLVRAFGLDIEVSDANITKMVPVDANYRIYPGQIEIDDGEITDYNYPYEQDDLGDANLAIEMGSLYTLDSNHAGDPNAGYGMQPGQSGILFKFYCDDDTFGYTITENVARGGIVMEDPCEEPNVSPILCEEQPPPTKCMAETNPDYANWQYWNEPNCWCYPRQCRGDADGAKLGPFWVSGNDLAILRTCISQLEGNMPPGCECSDFDHQKLGPFWVSGNDLAIMRLYISQLEGSVPVCGNPPDPNFNFWCDPTGCPPP